MIAALVLAAALLPGDARNAAKLYRMHCIGCHAADGTSKRQLAAVALPKVILRKFAFLVTGSVAVSPSTITFSSPDPDTTPVNGNTTATIMWSMLTR